jgi:hypothetical protein
MLRLRRTKRGKNFSIAQGFAGSLFAFSRLSEALLLSKQFSLCFFLFFLKKTENENEPA